ncbi:helix-turn-helix domain-containing protein [Sphingobacterium multivorum]|uniref:helix-turn-helix domain-containing protein n=1 Tax=Sphingobacterium multivorum TaxID=28454 RepID=UPI003DA3F367
MSRHIKLKILRDENAWSQDFVADRIGMSQAAYSKLESGQTKLTFDRAIQLAKVYEVEPEYFFSDDSRFVHYGKDNSFGPINKNTNYYRDDMVKELFEKILSEKDLRIEEYLQTIKILKQELEVANKRIEDFSSKLRDKL